eukprot:CAMPEP_0184505024 /NCGR_PEP_ID=MMETSP0113_2-20130426/52770_1 /TAXON_ID=91329 /ORGANISM="Norrisiella sphaerica, Strain BC52" /LENGTH=61 /DNA_ID=CAMNT_0026894691 /DNA_START=149 /DNA_END=334 /DNA_ORIENTATION=+
MAFDDVLFDDDDDDDDDDNDDDDDDDNGKDPSAFHSMCAQSRSINLRAHHIPWHEGSVTSG